MNKKHSESSETDCSQTVNAYARNISVMLCELCFEQRVSGFELNVTSHKVKACNKSHGSSEVTVVSVEYCGL